MAMEHLARKLATTIKDYLRGAADAVTRNRKYLAMVRDKGNLSFKHSGKSVDWGIEYDRKDLSINTGHLTFDPINRWIRAELGWGSYYMSDMIQKGERLQNDGKPALIKVYTEMGERLRNDMTEKFPGRLINADPSVAGHEGEITGLDTIFSISGAEAAANNVGVNNGTYAGLSTAGGNYGGSWELSGANSIWPLGDGDTTYDFHRPLVVLYDATAFAGAANTWDSNAETAIRYGLDHTNARNGGGASNMVDTVLLWRDGFRRFKDIQTAKERINVTGSSTLYRLGFRDIFNFDGVDITSEYDVPNLCGFGIPFGQVDVMSQQAELFDLQDDFHLDTQAHRFAADFFGQQKFKTIRNFFKLRPTSLA